jgi:hypothetical protein
MFADLAEHTRPWPAERGKLVERDRDEFFTQAWTRCENFLRTAQSAYLSRLPEEKRPDVDKHPSDPGLLAPAFRQRMRAAMRMPSLEALFPRPWTAAARRMLPSPSPKFTATAMWGPVLAWSSLELLAESIDKENPERAALDVFDRLRLREPFAQAFGALGFEGEEGWRVAARIKVVLLTGAGVGLEEATPKREVFPSIVEGEERAPAGDSSLEEIEGEPPQPEIPPSAGFGAGKKTAALAPALWNDPDVRWLTGMHEAGGHSYVVRELYEELLWWMLMPSLLKLAGESVPDRDTIARLSGTVNEALATAEETGYRIDEMIGSVRGEEPKRQRAGEAGEPTSAAESDQGADVEVLVEPGLEGRAMESLEESERRDSGGTVD